MTTEAHAERLGRLVRARRKRLQLHTATDFANAAHVSTRLIGDLETGRRANFSAANKAAIEEVLQWEYGSIDDTLGGGEPTERVIPATPEGASEGLKPLTRKEIARFILAAERKNDGTHSDADEKAIQDFIAHERASSAIRPGPDLGKLVEVNNAAWGASNDRMFELIEHPDVSDEDRISLLEQGIESSSVYSDFLIMAAYESTDTRARDILPSVFSMRSKMEEIRRALLEEKKANVVSLSDRRPVPPPPDLDDLDAAASRREKQSDGDHDNDE